jgi:hypothetical protein
MMAKSTAAANNNNNNNNFMNRLHNKPKVIKNQHKKLENDDDDDSHDSDMIRERIEPGVTSSVTSMYSDSVPEFSSLLLADEKKSDSDMNQVHTGNNKSNVLQHDDHATNVIIDNYIVPESKDILHKKSPTATTIYSDAVPEYSLSASSFVTTPRATNVKTSRTEFEFGTIFLSASSSTWLNQVQDALKLLLYFIEEHKYDMQGGDLINNIFSFLFLYMFFYIKRVGEFRQMLRQILI